MRFRFLIGILVLLSVSFVYAGVTGCEMEPGTDCSNACGDLFIDTPTGFAVDDYGFTCYTFTGGAYYKVNYDGDCFGLSGTGDCAEYDNNDGTKTDCPSYVRNGDPVNAGDCSSTGPDHTAEFDFTDPFFAGEETSSSSGIPEIDWPSLLPLMAIAILISIIVLRKPKD